MNNMDKKIYDIAKQYRVIPTYRVKYGNSYWNDSLLRKKIIEKVRICLTVSNRVVIVGTENEINYYKRYIEKSGFEEQQIVYMPIIDPKAGFDVCFKEKPETILNIINKQEDLVLIITCCYSKTAEMLFLGSGINTINIFDDLKFEEGVAWYNIGREIGRRGKAWLKSLAYRLDAILEDLKLDWGVIRKIRQSRHKMIDEIARVESYDALYVYKCQFESNKKTEKGKFYLQKIIWTYFQLRDFENVNRYIDTYTTMYDGKYIQFAKELDRLIQNVNDNIKSRTQRDIILQWIDAVPYSDSVDWGILKEERENGYEFVHTYSNVPQTRPCAKIIVTGEDYFEGKLYDRDISDVQNTKLGRILQDNNYDFNALGTALHCFDLDEDLKDYYFVDIYRTAAPFIMWLAKTRLALSDKPQFIVIHNILETHTPFYSGDMTEIWIPTKEELTGNNEHYDCLRKERYSYLETKLKDFQSCLNTDYVTTIYMSDHGRQTERDYEWEDIRCRAFCFLYGGGIKSGKAKECFDYTRLADCVEMIIQNNQSWETLERKYAIVEAEDYYSKGYCDNLIEKYKQNPFSENLYRTHMQFRAVCTKQDKLIRYPIEDIYVKMPEEVINEEEKYKDRIEALKELCGGVLIDIFHDERYKNCVEAYEKIGIVQDGRWIAKNER